MNLQHLLANHPKKNTKFDNNDEMHGSPAKCVERTAHRHSIAPYARDKLDTFDNQLPDGLERFTALWIGLFEIICIHGPRYFYQRKDKMLTQTLRQHAHLYENSW